MQFSLATTRGNIQENNAEFLDPLDVFRVVNAVSPRDWRFSVTFTETGSNSLALSSEPVLTDEELNRILSGIIPSLYAFDSLTVRRLTSAARIILDKHVWKPSVATYFDLVDIPLSEVEGQVEIHGYQLPANLANRDSFERWMRANSWIGSDRYRIPSRTITLEVFALHNVFSTQVAATGSPPLQFEVDRNIQVAGEILGRVRLRYSLTGGKRIRHAQFGEFGVRHVDGSFWKRLETGELGVELEIDEPHLSWFSNVGSNDVRHLRLLLDAILDVQATLAESPEYKGFLDNVHNCTVAAAAAAIAERQMRAQRSARVMVDGKHLMNLPSCENELVALYMKLEALEKLPFPCKIIEYTSRAGIDALANFQLSNTAAPQMFAPVEFEFDLENYFDHEHPLQQTALIICWQKDDSYASGRWRRGNAPWLAVVPAGHRSIPVLTLNQISGVEVEVAF